MNKNKKMLGKAAKNMYNNMLDNQTYTGYLFIAPNLILYLIFFVVPFISTLLLSFTKCDLFSAPKFTGLTNYIHLFQDDLFIKTLGNTFYYSFVAVFSAVFVAFWIALLLNRKMRGVVFFRTIFFLPYVSLMVAVAIVWNWMYNADYGLFNYILGLVGIDGPNWLNSATWAMPAIIIFSNWGGIGFPILIYLAAFQGIPDELYEAANIDGANWWQKIRYITIPMSSTATFFALTVSLIGAFQAFDQFYILTKGGPAYSTTTLAFYIYENAFGWFKMGYASTIAVVLFIVIMIITIIQWKIRNRWVFEG